MSCTQEFYHSYNYASSSGSSSPTDLHYPPLPAYQATSYQGEPPSYSSTLTQTTQYPSPPTLHPVPFESPPGDYSQLYSPSQYTTPSQYPESNQHEYPISDQRPMPKGYTGSYQTSATHHQALSHHPRPRSHSRESAPRIDIAHPYARLYAKKEEKRRKIWNHALEKSLFSPYELSTIGAPQRRTIYISSLEAHIDQLHAQLLGIGFWPIAFEKLEPYKGLNSKTAKSMVAGLQHDASVAKIKLLELERSNEGLKNALEGQPGYGTIVVDNYSNRA